jgi:hypothetical protein
MTIDPFSTILLSLELAAPGIALFSKEILRILKWDFGKEWTPARQRKHYL